MITTTHLQKDRKWRTARRAMLLVTGITMLATQSGPAQARWMVDEKVPTGPPQRKLASPFPVNTAATESSSKAIGNDRPDASATMMAILAKTIGISPTEVSEMLDRQNELAKFRAQYSQNPSFGGLWVDPFRPSQIYIGTLADDFAADELLSTKLTGAHKVNVVKVESSFTDMLRVRDQVTASLGGRVKSIGIGVDEPTNKLSVLADPTDVTVVEGVVSALGLQSRVSVQTGNPTTKSLTTYGGLGISVDGYNCTNGFAVTNGANDGVLTAGHCRNGAAVSNGDNLAGEVSETLGGDQDRQIHPAPSGAIGYAFMGGNQWMAVVGTMGSWSTGNWACAYGITTNRNTCGYADSTTWSAYSNGYVGANTYVSDILVTNFIRFSPDMWCQPGDSGGPIMNGGYALATMANEQWGWCLAPPIWNNMAGSGYWIKTI